MKILSNGDGYLTPQELQELQDLMHKVEELAERGRACGGYLNKSSSVVSTITKQKQ